MNIRQVVNNNINDRLKSTCEEMSLTSTTANGPVEPTAGDLGEDLVPFTLEGIYRVFKNRTLRIEEELRQELANDTKLHQQKYEKWQKRQQKKGRI